MNKKENKYIYLSYFMDAHTPLYGGGRGVSLTDDRSILKGDTANTKQLALHNHSGTHIDYPNHFFTEGATSEHYKPEFWQFKQPFLLNMPAIENEILLFTQEQLNQIPVKTDFLIVRTGFWKFRNEEKYWQYNPGLSPQMAAQLREHCPKLKVIGMDFISITSFQNRELGREAHRQFLGGKKPILLVEDMDLSQIEESPKQLMCSPLLIKGLDGSPVTITARLK
jgi:arylformamidase